MQLLCAAVAHRGFELPTKPVKYVVSKKFPRETKGLWPTHPVQRCAETSITRALPGFSLPFQVSVVTGSCKIKLEEGGGKRCPDWENFFLEAVSQNFTIA